MGNLKSPTELRQMFKDEYEHLWFKYQHHLSENERVAINFHFGVSAPCLSNSEIAHRLNFKNRDYASVVIRRGLDKLRQKGRKQTEADPIAEVVL